MGQFFKIGLKIFLYILGTAITIALLLLIVAKLKYFSIVHPTPEEYYREYKSRELWAVRQ